MQNKKVIIGIPTVGHVDWRFASSLMTLQCPNETKVIWQVKTMIDTARNRIAQLFLQDEADFLLMIDDDMLIPPETVINLMRHDVDVVGCLAFKRREDFEPCVYRKEKGNYIPILPNIFQEVDAIGSSGLLIKREVLEKLEYPYFETGYDKKGERFAKGNHFSVDFDFSLKAKEKGFKIFCDPEVEFGHIGEAPIINKETFLKHVKKIYEKEKGTDTGSIQH
jgi:GT2 family glycosyltransferase